MSELELFDSAGDSPFDAVKRHDDRGEHWTGRDLMPVMDYSRWEKFAEVIEKAKASLAIVDGQQAAEDHFTVWGSDGGRWGNQRLGDFRLTRFGAYLTAMAGDDTKESVARARVYFAVRTREAEVSNPDLSDPLAELQRAGQQLSQAVELALVERQRADTAETKVAELEPLAEGYRHFLESDGTVKWANACEHLGVAPNLFGAYLRDRKVTYTDEYVVTRKGKQEKRQGERHNRPYGDYKHWFAFPAYGDTSVDAVPAHKQFDRRVTKAGMDGLRRVLKRHVVECGRCSMCESVRRNAPQVYAKWRPQPRQQQIGGAA